MTKLFEWRRKRFTQVQYSPSLLCINWDSFRRPTVETIVWRLPFSFLSNCGPNAENSPHLVERFSKESRETPLSNLEEFEALTCAKAKRLIRGARPALSCNSDRRLALICLLFSSILSTVSSFIACKSLDAKISFSKGVLDRTKCLLAHLKIIFDFPASWFATDSSCQTRVLDTHISDVIGFILHVLKEREEVVDRGKRRFFSWWISEVRDRVFFLYCDD